MSRVFQGFQALGRLFARSSPAVKAYVLFQALGPFGIVLAVVGATSHRSGLLIVGLVLGGLYVVDMILVLPIMRARQDLRQRRRG